MVAVTMEVMEEVMTAAEEISKLPDPETLTVQWQKNPYRWGVWGSRTTEPRREFLQRQNCSIGGLQYVECP